MNLCYFLVPGVIFYPVLFFISVHPVPANLPARCRPTCLPLGYQLPPNWSANLQATCRPIASQMSSTCWPTGRPWKAMACRGRPWPAVEGHGLPAITRHMAGLGQPWPSLAGHGRPWTAMAGNGRLELHWIKG